MAFEPKDNVIYDELWNVVPVAAVAKGDAAVVQDVFGFYFVKYDPADVEYDDSEVCFIYRMRQVEADKKTGTGEDISSGEKVYYYPTTDNVSATATGTYAVDYYFCGWAKKDATTSDTTVLINFDGTRYNENI